MSKTGENRADCDKKDEPRTPVPAVVVSVDAMRVVHIADVEFLFADEVEIGDEYTGDGTHKTGITREESKELSTLNND